MFFLAPGSIDRPFRFFNKFIKLKECYFLVKLRKLFIYCKFCAKCFESSNFRYNCSAESVGERARALPPTSRVALEAELYGGENYLHWKTNLLPLFNIMTLWPVPCYSSEGEECYAAAVNVVDSSSNVACTCSVLTETSKFGPSSLFSDWTGCFGKYFDCATNRLFWLSIAAKWSF